MRLDLTLLALVAPLAVVGDLRHSSRRNHHEVAKRADGSVQLHKRFSGTRWTFYDVGGAAGACGAVNSPGQHIVALNSAQYGSGYPGPNCGKTIVMKIGNKQTTATITDECPGCPYGGLDLTTGLFSFFDSLGVGVLSGDWWFADDAPPADPSPTPKPTPKPKPTTTSKPPPPPTTTHHTTTSTTSTPAPTTHTPTTTSQSSAVTSSSASSQAPSSSINKSSGISELATPTGVASTGNGAAQNILDCNNLLMNMGGLVVAGAEAQA
ncbi:hypothetical protein P691DRAFT_772427 [Macrolepiota fuliginosa MF-IS2]|uniref:RlpA-like protein double-psi beta-barrel domain-containing protein n=1 Tax=Macrolepiota fuliginosa MF-IS2 TaxID=1400762 RepID=A0A9P5XNA6_9AGAR|nr:hypothetical protein P691DRAFT_772427 [Macrolepiota fuliginosa MF-IS2]